MNTCQTTPSSAADHIISGDDEWEAAKALACLSHSVTGDIDEGSWMQLPHNCEQAISIQSEDEPELKTSITSSKLGQDFTEVEREGRRLRRVLANRESARRTIRRRQAMQEELTRKAADLVSENENLKKNKELAAVEYNSLRKINNSLRTQMDKIVKAEVKETNDESKLTTATLPTDSTTSPTLLHNHSSGTPFFWSAYVQPVGGLLLQNGSQNTCNIIPEIPIPIGAFKPSNRIESPLMMNEPGTPLYVLSLHSPSLFHAQSNQFHPCSSNQTYQQETPVVQECGTSTSKTTDNVESHLKERPLKVETEIPASMDTIYGDFLHEAESDFLPDEGTPEGSKQLSTGMVQGTAASSPYIQSVIARQSESPQEDYTSNIKVFPSAAGHVAGASAEMCQEHVTCSSNVSGDAIIATEARRKRKAIMQLKSQHCHQFHVIY